MKETEFQDKVMRELRKIPLSAWEKINDRVTIGLLDVYGCANTVPVVLELKTNTKLSRLQLSKIRHYLLAGMEVFAVDPKNWPEVLEYIQNCATYQRGMWGDSPERIPARLMPSKKRPRKLPTLLSS